jgi:hypothetical protein
MIGPPPRGSGGGIAVASGTAHSGRSGSAVDAAKLSGSVGVSVTRMTAPSGDVCISALATRSGPLRSTTNRDQPGRNDPARSAGTVSGKGIAAMPVQSTSRVSITSRGGASSKRSRQGTGWLTARRSSTPAPARRMAERSGSSRASADSSCAIPGKAKSQSSRTQRKIIENMRIARLIPGQATKVNSACASQTGEVGSPDLIFPPRTPYPAPAAAGLRPARLPLP